MTQRQALAAVRRLCPKRRGDKREYIARFFACSFNPYTARCHERWHGPACLGGRITYTVGYRDDHGWCRGGTSASGDSYEEAVAGLTAMTEKFRGGNHK